MNGASRRQFLGALASLLAACGRRPAGSPAPRSILEVDVGGLTEDGAALMTSEPGPDGAPILVVRRAPGEFLALSTQCTHEGCPLKPPAGGVLTCPCHGSRFDLEGKVLQGPAYFPLPRYAVRYDAPARRLAVKLGG